MIFSEDGLILETVKNIDIDEKGLFEIPDYVTSIGNYAFCGCISLTTLTIPNSVTSIGDWTFQGGCTSLTTLTIPNSVTSIGHGTFWGCTSLTTLAIPDSVTSIGNYAFYVCTSLTTLTIPDSVTSIGNRAFCSCTSLTTLTLPDSVMSIGDGAFSGCRSLTTLTIPDSVTSIGNEAFLGCTNLNFIVIDGTDKAKFEKIKLLLPPELQAKAIPSGILKEVKEKQQEMLNKLLDNPKVSRLYGCEGLCDDVLTLINRFDADENKYYKYAKKEIERLSFPEDETDLESYCEKMGKIIKYCSDFAEKKVTANEQVCESNAYSDIETSSNPWAGLSMQIIGGFMSALGATAVALAFVALINPPILGVAGLVVAGVGVSGALAGIGLFTAGTVKYWDEASGESMNHQLNIQGENNLSKSV